MLARPASDVVMPASAVSITYLAGLIEKHEINQFKRLLFRATKGKVLCKIMEEAIVEYV